MNVCAVRGGLRRLDGQLLVQLMSFDSWLAADLCDSQGTKEQGAEEGGTQELLGKGDGQRVALH